MANSSSNRDLKLQEQEDRTSEFEGGRLTSLSERLGSLFNSSPRSSTEYSRPNTPLSQRSTDNDNDIRWPMFPKKMPLPRVQSVKSPTSFSFFKSAAEPPVTRRLGGRTPQSEGQGDSLDSEALREAMEDDLFLFSPSISRPPTAHFTSYQSRTSSRDMRSPKLLNSLARNTLPTASLTPIHTPAPSASEAPVAREQSPPSRTSLESLKTLRDRGMSMHTSATTSQGFSPSQVSRWWFQPENKKAVDRLLDEDDQSSTAASEEEKIRRKYLAPRNPMVFCHGLLGFDTVSIGPLYPLQVSHWRGIKEVLEANGIEVLITRVPATSSIQERAAVLEQSISDVYPGRSVHLIGHSMGGLDCRHLVTHIQMRTFKVLSVTTLATPHRGSAFADHFISTIGRERLPSVMTLLDLLPNGGGDGRAFESLTLDSMRKFNEETPNVHGVEYFSWGAEATPGLLDPFRWPHSIILEKEGPNDGLVSVESAKWGTYLGTLQDVNHLDLIGWTNNTRYKWAELIGREIKFKPATFYLGVADYLAEHVEGQQRGSRSRDEENVSDSKPDMPGVEIKEVDGSTSRKLP